MLVIPHQCGEYHLSSGLQCGEYHLCDRRTSEASVGIYPP